MADALDVYWGESLIGQLRFGEGRGFCFQYDAGWLSLESAIPLSVRLPLREELFSHEVCRVFFSNLLPEGNVRALVARKLGISEANDFKLLEALGGECAGALSLLPEGEKPVAEGGYESVSGDELDRMIEEMPRVPLLLARDELRLSLAGAQQKLPIFFGGGKLSLPTGGSPSSHILKPGVRDFPELVQNEAFCMRLARTAGIPVPDVSIWKGREDVLLVERYDRQAGERGHLIRAHQEDFCQALGHSHSNKYEGEGGPSLERCFSLIDGHGTQPVLDKRTLLRTVVFNYLIGNCDAHGKNFSMLISRDEYRLAPAYDLVSTRAYPHLSPKMAMRLGGQLRSESVRKENWEALAGHADVATRAVLNICREMGEKVPKAAEALAGELSEKHGGHETLDLIQKYIARQADRLLRLLK